MKTDLRVIKTKRNIKQAFIEMLCEMDYEQITVQALTQRAMVNRKTFYSHYDNLDELLHELQLEMAQDFAKRTKRFNRPQDMDEITREFFLISEELGRLGEAINLNDSHVRKDITNELMNQNWNFPPKYSSPYAQNIIKSFISQATLAIYRQWIADGKKLSLEEVINLATKLICDGVGGLENESC